MTSISPPLARPIFHLRSRFWPIIRVRLGKTTREFSAAVVQVFRRVAMATATGTWRRRSSTLLFCQYCNGSWLGQLHGCIGITDDGDNIDTARHMRYIWSRKHPNCLRRRHTDDSTLRQLVINFNLHRGHLLRVQAVLNVANHYQDKPCSFIQATKHLQLCVLSVYNQHLKRKSNSQSVSAKANFNPEAMLRADTINLEDHSREPKTSSVTLLSYKHSPQADAMRWQSSYSGLRAGESLAVWYCSSSKGARCLRLQVCHKLLA